MHIVTIVPVNSIITWHTEKEFYEVFHFIKSAKYPQNHPQFKTNILVMAITCFSPIHTADRNELMLVISHISSVQCHISNTPRAFSAISGRWLGARFLPLQRQEVHPASATLPGMTVYWKTAAYIVPDLCAGEAVLRDHLLYLGLCSSLAPSLPSL